MKIIILMPHLLHYFNLTLNKVNEIPGVELLVLIPKEIDVMAAGGGINQTRKNVKFRILGLNEFKMGHYYSFKGFAKLLRKEKPNIILCSDEFMYQYILSLPLWITMKIFNIKLIMQSNLYQIPHYKDAFRRFGKEPNRIDKLPRLLRFIVVNFGIEYFLRRGRAYINKLIYNRPDAHLVYIEEGYSVYGSYGVAKEKIFVTDNSTDTDLLAQTEISIEGLPRILPPSSNRVLHVGRLTKWKRVDLLIQSTARLKNDFPNIELVIIGEGPELEPLQSLANSLGVKEHVRFIGGVYDSEELARYFKASSIYVLAGKGGLSINDAMFYGLPIICSVCDGTEKKLVRDGFNGSIFDEGSEEDLVEKISIILGDEELRKNMSKNSRMIINKEINIHTVLEKWKEGFDYVLGKK